MEKNIPITHSVEQKATLSSLGDLKRKKGLGHQSVVLEPHLLDSRISFQPARRDLLSCRNDCAGSRPAPERVLYAAGVAVDSHRFPCGRLATPVTVPYGGG